MGILRPSIIRESRTGPYGLHIPKKFHAITDFVENGPHINATEGGDNLNLIIDFRDAPVHLLIDEANPILRTTWTNQVHTSAEFQQSPSHLQSEIPRVIRDDDCPAVQPFGRSNGGLTIRLPQGVEIDFHGESVDVTSLQLIPEQVRLNGYLCNPNRTAHMERSVMWSKRTIVTVGCLGLLVLSGISGASAAPSETRTPVVHEVTVTGADLAYSPADLSIELGDIVYFHWTETSMDHNVAESSSEESNEYKEGGFRSGDVESTVHYNVTFDSPGSFWYICEPHATMGMKGVIHVIDPDAPPVEEKVRPDSVPGFTTILATLAVCLAAMGRRGRD